VVRTTFPAASRKRYPFITGASGWIHSEAMPRTCRAEPTSSSVGRVRLSGQAKADAPRTKGTRMMKRIIAS
jgi:hypothetical protein